jgi:hypothetical protein
MEKAITINGEMVSNFSTASVDNKPLWESQKDQIDAWKELYQEVRRQWAEAEHSRYRGGKSIR